MRQIPMYKYRSDSGIVITPINLGIGEPIITYRLVADANKMLTNGEKRQHVVEITEEEIVNWTEVDKTEEEIERDELPEVEEDNYKELLDIVTGEMD